MHVLRKLCFTGVLLLAGCARRLDYVVLSYSEEPTFCMGCPSFRVELRSGGHVNLFGLSGCAIPGEYHYRVPESALPSLLSEFTRAGFFWTSRLNLGGSVTDWPIKRLGYRDESKIHEVVRTGPTAARLSNLEKIFRKTVMVDKYLVPSVPLYHELLKSGWNINTLGQDHQNALVAAVSARDLPAINFLLQHGAAISQRSLEFATSSRSSEIFHLLAKAGDRNFQSSDGGELLNLAARAGKLPIMRELLERGAPVNYRQPHSGRTPLLEAADSCSLDAVRELLAHRADVTLRDDQGQTALSVSLSHQAGCNASSTMLAEAEARAHAKK